MLCVKNIFSVKQIITDRDRPTLLCTCVSERSCSFPVVRFGLNNCYQRFGLTFYVQRLIEIM